MSGYRKYHPWWEWECYRNGFYRTRPPKRKMTDDDCREMYREFLANLDLFEIGMHKVASQWPNSCDQFLTNTNINRIAWLGQSAMCAMTGVPSVFRGGFRLLSPEQQSAANGCAEKFLNNWIEKNVNTLDG